MTWSQQAATMRRRHLAALFAAGVSLASLGFGAAARADFYDGMTAYQNRNYPTAMQELAPLADQGDARAQALVGAMYRDGQAVPQDYVLAHQWLNLAAAGGQVDAARARDELAKHMVPAQIAEAQQLARAWRPPDAVASNQTDAGDNAVPSGADRQLEGSLTATQISDLQWQLAIHGYDPGTADGVVGWQTQQAIADYQKDANLPVDGQPSPALLSHLQYTNPPVRSARMLASLRNGAAPAATPQQPASAYDPAYGYDNGATGGDLGSVPISPDLLFIYTTSVQQALAAKGYRPGIADGKLGPRTRAAIRRYQQDYGLPVTGEVSLALVNHLRLITGFPVGYPQSQI
jgi:peptidoglycan hydrolase-like protein with peptidoglycan-binding domain